MKASGIQGRYWAAACSGSALCTLALGRLDIDSPALAAIRVLAAFFAVGVAPGILLVLLGNWGRRLSALQALGLAGALSLALAQLLCWAALSLHIPCWTLAVSLLAAVSLVAVAILSGWRNASHPLIFWPHRERWLCGALLLLSVTLYPKGSPVLAISYEDFWHLSVVSRLAGNLAPDIHSTFVEPGVVFTHPASGMHFFMALVTDASGEKALFVFNKMRSYAGVFGPLFLYLIAARILFRSVAAAWAGAGVVALVLTGSLADSRWHWGQAIPVSHNTDLAMGLLVPAAVWLLLKTLTSPDSPSHRWWFGTTCALLAMVICSHVREAPQILLYLGAFAFTIWKFPGSGRRIFVLIACLVACLLIYQQWHKEHVLQITERVSERRAALEATFRAMHGADWWRAPVAVYPVETLWYGWHGVFIVVLPMVLCFGAHQRLRYGLLFSVLFALLLIRVPVLSLAVNWATYDEILMFPVRFFTPFSLLIPGVLCWWVARSSSSALWSTIVAGFGTIGLVWARWHAEALMTCTPDVFFGLALLSTLLGLVWSRWHGPPFASHPTSRGEAVRTAATLLVVGLCTGNLAASPFSWLSSAGDKPSARLLHSGRALWTWRNTVENFRDGPPVGILEWVSQNVPPDGVVIWNPNTDYPVTAFAPTFGSGWDVVFRLGLTTPMSQARAVSQNKYGGPPFFNANETAAERMGLCRQLRAQAVILSPSDAAQIKVVLDADSASYILDYADSGWFAYRIRPAPSPTRN